MGSHHPFGHLKHKLWPKERPGVKLAIWLPTTKSHDPIPLRSGDARHAVEKLLIRATTLLQTSFSSEVFSQSYGTPKSRESQPWQFRDSHLGVPRQKAPWAATKYTIMGEGGGFPQVQAVVSLVCPSCPWLVLCTNHFVLVLCRHVWISEACQFFLVPSRSSNTPPSTPPKCCESGSVPWLLALSLFFVWDSHLSPSRSWECVTLT
jgi:hypothetical protein